MSVRFKISVSLVALFLVNTPMFAGRQDSLRYYFKLSYYAGYGIETFGYSTSHSFNAGLKVNSYGYGGGFGNTKIVAQKYGHEIKLDCDLPYGIKIVNSLAFNSIRFHTPTYSGDLDQGYNTPSVYTYKARETIDLETVNGFLGVGYGRKRKCMIWDGDLGVDFYKQTYLSIRREVDITGNTGYYPTPQTFSVYGRKYLNSWGPGLAIKGSFNVSYKLVSFIYLRAGILYRYDIFGARQESYSSQEYQTMKFERIRTYMLNLGISLSVK